MRVWACTFTLLLAGVVTTPVLPAQATAPDNTKVNKRDRDRSQPTADQAKNSKGDLETMRKIRRSLLEDKSLSTYAHNVKVISADGKVTLKGPVRSEDERRTVLAKAEEVVGSGNVVDQLSIKPGKNEGR